jgi:hypothetical protein
MDFFFNKTRFHKQGNNFCSQQTQKKKLCEFELIWEQIFILPEQFVVIT